MKMSIEMELPTGAKQPRVLHWYAGLGDYWALTKPEVNFLIVITTFAGFYLGYPKQSANFPLLLLVHSLLGTLLVASGTGTLKRGRAPTAIRFDHLPSFDLCFADDLQDLIGQRCRFARCVPVMLLWRGVFFVSNHAR